MKFHFETFGCRDVGSSRLRAWTVADELVRLGHRAEIGTSDPRAEEADVWVFQKSRQLKALRRAKAAHATVVFDFDDNYLLRDTGVRAEMLAFMNEADLVTVGSTMLYNEAASLHERVALFENPLDVEDESVVRPARSWNRELVWFGNRTNLVSLDLAGLGEEVTTITEGGDIEWQRDSVDRHLVQYDLCVIPVEEDPWRAAKNANRLLKCVALGLPALVSATREHVKVAEEVGLPDILLMEEGWGESWADRVDAIGHDFESVRDALLQARERALQRWSVRSSVEKWLETVGNAHMAAQNWKAPQRPAVTPAEGELEEGKKSGDPGCDVVILADGEEGRWQATLRSVERYCKAGRIAVVAMGTPDPGELLATRATCVFVEDLFELYAAFSKQLLQGNSENVLVLRAGAELRPGFVREVDGVAGWEGVTAFSVQEGGGSLHVQTAPQSLVEVLRRIYVPACTLLPKRSFAAPRGGGRLDRYGALIVWYGLVQALYRWEYTIRVVDTPVVVAPRTAMEPGPVRVYSQLLDASGSEAFVELPKVEKESERLMWVWCSSVVEECRDAYGDFAASVLPEFLCGEVGATRGAIGNGVSRNRGIGEEHSTVKRMPPFVYGVVRAGWPAVRDVIPEGFRTRLYHKYKWTYFRFFPERQP